MTTDHTISEATERVLSVLEPRPVGAQSYCSGTQAGPGECKLFHAPVGRHKQPN
jgi:hypothetical protein